MLVRSPFWPRILASMAARFDGQIATDSVRLGWLSPIEARGITIRDAKGEPLATAASLRTDARLIWLLTHRSNLGVVRIEQPELFVRLREDGSNLEDAIAVWRSRPRNSPAAAGTVEFSDGTVSVRGDAAGRDAELRSLRGKVQLAATADGASTATVEACELVSGTRHGTCRAEATWQGAGESLCWSVSAQLESVVLSAVAPVLRRYRRDVELAGSVSGDVRFGWDGPRRQLTVQLRQVSARPLQLTAPAWIGDDRLALEDARLIGECVVSNGVWDVSGGSLECDAGHLELNGRFSRPTAFDGQRWLRSVGPSRGGKHGVARRGESGTTGTESCPRRCGSARARNSSRASCGFTSRAGRNPTTPVAGRPRSKHRTWLLVGTAARSRGASPCNCDAAGGSDGSSLACGTSGLPFPLIPAAHRAGHGGGRVLVFPGLQSGPAGQRTPAVRRPRSRALQATGTLNAGLHWRALDGQRVAITGDGLIEDMELSDSPDRFWSRAGVWRSPWKWKRRIPSIGWIICGQRVSSSFRPRTGWN